MAIAGDALVGPSWFRQHEPRTLAHSRPLGVARTEVVSLPTSPTNDACADAFARTLGRAARILQAEHDPRTHSRGPPRPSLPGGTDESGHLGIPADDLARFADLPLRSLYAEGLCGGAILPLSRIGRPSQDVHVPIAHQSALAGVLLGSRLVARAIGHATNVSSVSRIDVLRPLGEYLTQPRQKDSRGICICQDHVYQEAF